MFTSNDKLKLVDIATIKLKQPTLGQTIGAIMTSKDHNTLVLKLVKIGSGANTIIT